MTQNIRVDDNICSKVWLTPIAHKCNVQGIEKLGLEMEIHAYEAETLAPLGTPESNLTPQDILSSIVLNTPHASFVLDTDTSQVIGVKLPTGGNFSLEPGGQIEYASLPCTSLEELAKDMQHGLEILERAAENRVLFLSHGTNPITKPTHPLVVPKKRYQFMTRYFESAPKNIRGIDMMRHSATIQPNLDIFENAQWHTGVELVLNLIPITSQMFANSRYFQSHKSKFYSERQNIWANMDPSRSGIPTNLLENIGCPETECTYAKWAKSAYMLFIENLPIEEQPLYGEITFEQWMEKGYKNKYPTIGDWEVHLSTMFPHLRLRHFLEIRNIDAQPFEHSFATIAFFTALLKSRKTQKKTWDLISQFDFNTTRIFAQNTNFFPLFFPLLDLASEILEEQKEFLGAKVIQEYKNFITNREIYWEASSALDFVKKRSTLFPAQEFIKFFNV